MAININGIFPGELLPTKTVGGCIDIFENAWSNSKQTIDSVELECSNLDNGINWSRSATVNGGVNQNIRTNYEMSLTSFANDLNNPLIQNIHNQMYLLLLAASIPYARKHDIDSLYHEGYNMLRYTGGQEYKAHADGDTSSGRSVSAIIYLNDDYEGGEVEFINFNIKIKPKSGMLLLFPSNYAYTHIAHPVISGTKYALVTWMKDRIL
jgi:predicted 2-oxoglutarate/Fe(II)-dependent dioxygenase YbiX